MANIETPPGKPPVVESPLFKLILQTSIPALLGILVSVAFSINAAQKDQGTAISEMSGKLGVIVQQNTDFGGRLLKVEQGVDVHGREIGEVKGRVLALESLRRK